MKVLIATNCSPAADLVVAEAAARPWTRGTTFSILNVLALHRFAGLPALIAENKRKVDQLGVFMEGGAAKLERAGHHTEVRVAEGFPRKVISEYARNGALIWSWSAPTGTARSHAF